MIQSTPTCKWLRTKGAFVPYGKPVPWEAGYVSTAVFWCLKTADAMGPDDSFVHPHACVATRTCFCEREGEPYTTGIAAQEGRRQKHFMPSSFRAIPDLRSSPLNSCALSSAMENLARMLYWGCSNAPV